MVTVDVILLLFVLLGVAILYLFYQLLTKGMTGLLFDARIAHKSGTVEQASDWLIGGRLRVFVLKRGGRTRVGIQVVSTSWLYWSETPVHLSRENAQRLIGALEDAVAHA
jgi:hypothetical protein